MVAFFCGVDWSESGHDVAVVDAAGTVVARARIEESPAGVKELLRLLAGLRTSHRHGRKQVSIAIETSRGLLVAALRAAGQPVVAINPTVVARYRGRLNPTRKKADVTDAVLLANILRTDAHLHRRLWTPSPQGAAITVLARAHTDAGRRRHQLRFKLRSALREYYPAALEAWKGLPDDLLRGEARAVLALAPTPRRAARLSVGQLADALAQGGRTRLVHDHAGRLHELFRRPQLRQPDAVEEAMGAAMLARLALLNQACHTLDDLAVQVTEAFDAHPQAPIYRSFPGCGPIIGARLLAEIGDDPDRFITARGLLAYAGAAPLTWASGASSVVTHRRIANRALKATGHVWAFAALTRSLGARAHYDRRREAGDRYAAALRHLNGRLLRCLHHCLSTGELYREERAFPRGVSVDE